MPLTMAQAITRTQDRLDELGAPIAWQLTSLRRWINEGVRDVARRTETLLVDVELPLAAGESGTTLPADVLRVHRAAFTEGTDRTYGLEFRDFNAVDAVWYTNATTAIQATPREFALKGFPPQLDILVNPRPSTPGTLTVHYYALPVELADDGTDDGEDLQVVEAYTDLVVDYASFLALRRDRDPRWQEHRVAYEDNLTAMLDATRRWSDQAGNVSRSGQQLPDWLVYP